jgi:hypothetical protein
MKSLSSSK